MISVLVRVRIGLVDVQVVIVVSVVKEPVLVVVKVVVIEMVSPMVLVALNHRRIEDLSVSSSQH